MKHYNIGPNEEKMLREMQDIDSNNSVLWFIEAKNLKSCADLIYLEGKKEETSLKYSVYFMLIGFAFENLIKGIYSLNKAVTKNGEMIKWPGDGHSLIDLMNFLNNEIEQNGRISLKKRDRLLLGKLTEFIRWLGRYPVSKTFKMNIPKKIGTTEFESPFKFLDPDEYKNDIEHLYSKLANIIKNKLRIKS